MAQGEGQGEGAGPPLGGKMPRFCYGSLQQAGLNHDLRRPGHLLPAEQVFQRRTERPAAEAACEGQGLDLRAARRVFIFPLDRAAEE